MERKKSNATLGAETERALAELLAEGGWFCALIPHGSGGAQPFDLMGVRSGGRVIGVDAKRSQDGKLRCSRIEANQQTAMDALSVTGGEGFFAVFIVKDEGGKGLPNEPRDEGAWKALRWTDIRPYVNDYNRGGKNIDLMALPCAMPLTAVINADFGFASGKGDA